MNFIDEFDNLSESLKNNKNTMLITTGVLSFLTVCFSYGVPDIFSFILANPISKVIIFIVISLISNKNPALGIILAIFILTVYQMVTYKELSKTENYGTINQR
jgi:hypothetical protein